LCISLVHQYLESTNSALTDQLKIKYQVKETNVKLEEVLSKWNEEQLARNIVYQHLKTVTPSLAIEFKNTYFCSLEGVPQQLLKSIEMELVKKSQSLKQTIVEAQKIHKAPDVKEEKREVNNNAKRLGRKLNRFSAKEVLRIEKAIVNKEDMRVLAKEMGRTYYSVHSKIRNMQRAGRLCKGKFTLEEKERLKQALENNEDFKEVAIELCRDSNTVHNRMLAMKSNPKSNQRQKKKGFTFAEDLLILEKVIPRLKLKKLSSTGFLSQSDTVKLATELKRNFKGIALRWERSLQPWLLQHFTGTSGFRVEKMLTSLVAEKYNDPREVDWAEIVNQHKEMAGQTSAGVSLLFQCCLKAARRQKKADVVSLLEVAECAAAYQARKESAAKIAHREKIIEYFEKRVDELGIQIVV